MRPDEDSLRDIALGARRTLRFVGEMSEADFLRDERTQAAVQHQLIIIGEAAKALSPSFREAHPEVAWREISGLRDILVHAYHRVSLREIWRIAESDLPGLLEFAERTLDSP